MCVCACVHVCMLCACVVVCVVVGCSESAGQVEGEKKKKKKKKKKQKQNATEEVVDAEGQVIAVRCETVRDSLALTFCRTYTNIRTTQHNTTQPNATHTTHTMQHNTTHNTLHTHNTQVVGQVTFPHRLAVIKYQPGN